MTWTAKASRPCYVRQAFKNIFPVSPENQKLGICQWGCFPGSDKRIIIFTGVLPIIPASFNPQDLEQPQEPAKRSSFPRTLVRKAPRTAICCPTGHRFRERKLFKHPIFISRSNDRRLDLQQHHRQDRERYPQLVGEGGWRSWPGPRACCFFDGLSQYLLSK